MSPLTKNNKSKTSASKTDIQELDLIKSSTSSTTGGRARKRKGSRATTEEPKVEDSGPTQMTNSQVLERAMSKDVELLEEPVEIDLPQQGVRVKSEHPDLSKRSSSPNKHDRARSASPRKQEDSPPPLPPKPPRHLTNDVNLRDAFHDPEYSDVLSPEQKAIGASKERQNEHAPEYETEPTANSSRTHKRPPTAIITEDDYLPAEESPNTQTQGQLKESINECEKLRERVKELEKELKDTQDFVFSMQPRASRLTESEALTDFNHLWGSVEEWVVTNLGDAIEAIQLGTAKPSYSAGARRLLLLVPAPGREAYAYENTDEHNVMATIMRFLCDQAFDRDFYCNIEEGGSNFLKTIETSMRNLEPRRDVITCRTWRAETWLAITNRHTFAEYRARFSDQVTKDLGFLLHTLAPNTDQSELERSIMTAIVEPALSLAHKLHLSVDKYSIKWTPYHTSPWEKRQAMRVDLSQYDCVDLLTGRNVRFPVKGKIITYVFDLCPSLELQTAQAQYLGQPKVLKKAKVLVAVTSEEKGVFDPRLPNSGEFFTVFGRIEDRFTRGRYFG